MYKVISSFIIFINPNYARVLTVSIMIPDQRYKILESNGVVHKPIGVIGKAKRVVLLAF